MTLSHCGFRLPLFFFFLFGPGATAEASVVTVRFVYFWRGCISADTDIILYLLHVYTGARVDSLFFFFGSVLLLLRSKFGALRMDRQYLRKPAIYRKILAITNNIISFYLFFVKYEEKKTA